MTRAINRIASLTVAAASLAIATPSLSQEVNRTFVSKPSDADIAAAMAVGGEFVSLVEAANFDGALDLVKGTNPIWAKKVAEVDALVNEAEAKQRMYGATKTCVASSYIYVSEFRIMMRYVCQHEKGLTRWRLTVDELPRGWTISNVRFTDTF